MCVFSLPAPLKGRIARVSSQSGQRLGQLERKPGHQETQAFLSPSTLVLNKIETDKPISRWGKQGLRDVREFLSGVDSRCHKNNLNTSPCG